MTGEGGTARAVAGSDIIGSGEHLHVLVPSSDLADAVRALSPRVVPHEFAPEAGSPVGEAGLAQVWIPHPGSGFPGDDFFRALPRLRLVQLMSAGAEVFAGRLPAGVVLCNARGAYTPPTAEWVVMVAVAALRELPGFVRSQSAGSWERRVGRSLVGAQVLVVGAGDIGRRVGRMLAGFDVELTYVARTARDGVHGVDELPRLLPSADVVVLIVPLTPETDGMVDRAFLAAMKDGALLVNAARGRVVDTEALVAELVSGRLRAALDVTEPEPLPSGHPLWSAPHLLLTPHIGGTVPETPERARAVVLDQVRRVLTGAPLAHVVGAY